MPLIIDNYLLVATDATIPLCYNRSPFEIVSPMRRVVRLKEGAVLRGLFLALSRSHGLRSSWFVFPSPGGCLAASWPASPWRRL